MRWIPPEDYDLTPSEVARPLGLGPADKLSNQISSDKQTRDINKLASFPGCLGMSLLRTKLRQQKVYKHLLSYKLPFVHGTVYLTEAHVHVHLPQMLLLEVSDALLIDSQSQCWSLRLQRKWWWKLGFPRELKLEMWLHFGHQEE